MKSALYTFPMRIINVTWELTAVSICIYMFQYIHRVPTLLLTDVCLHIVKNVNTLVGKEHMEKLI